MANIAAIYHWPPSEMYAMDMVELIEWHDSAIERSGTSEE